MLKTNLKTKAFINGGWVSSPVSFAVSNPFDQSVIAHVTDCDVALTEQAIECAYAAFPDWSRKLAKDRADILLRWADLMVAEIDNLAMLLTTEQGKTFPEARGEIFAGIDSVRWAAQAALRLYGQSLPPFKTATDIQLTPEPIGVCAAITPWNFPVSMVTRKVAPALAAGCTMILKPAEDTPLCALFLADLAQQSGMPAGVLNVIPCSRENVSSVGELLCTHPKVRKISFTGSTAVGRILSGWAAPHLKRLSLELGGNAPFIIFDTADLHQAADGLIASKFRNAGQTCICANRILVQQSIFEEFCSIFRQKVENIKVGNGLDPANMMGAVINQAARQKIDGFIAAAIEEGAKITLGGTSKGLCIAPTILTGIAAQSVLLQEEIFGPVAVLIPFADEKEAISIANQTEYGLAAYIFTQNQSQAGRVGQELDFGMVGVNEPLISHASIPFGGRKASGYGREGGPHCLEPFLDYKYILKSFSS